MVESKSTTEKSIKSVLLSVFTSSHLSRSCGTWVAVGWGGQIMWAEYSTTFANLPRPRLEIMGRRETKARRDQMAQSGHKGIAMNGMIAHWYAKTTAHDLEEFQALAERIKTQLSGVQDILEVAPGPGYLSLELARESRLYVTGVDISPTFVDIARKNAEERQLSASFVEGNAAAMPFHDGAFDFIVCRAAFKNFSQPLQALNEFYRVLRPGGWALIIDLRRDVGLKEIRDYVKNMRLPPLRALFTVNGLKQLRRWAYSPGQIEQMAANSRFSGYHLDVAAMDFQLKLLK